MTPEKAKVVIGNRVVDLTRYLMERDVTTQDVAYAKLYATEFFRLLTDPDTRLFLEEDEYLRTALERELTEGADALYEFIKPEP